jgi:putative FmdB family regulatory protein
MPIYEYACRGCGARFEELRKAADRLQPAACPTCGAEHASLRLSVPGHVGAGNGAAVDTCAVGPGSCCGGYCPN